MGTEDGDADTQEYEKAKQDQELAIIPKVCEIRQEILENKDQPIYERNGNQCCHRSVDDGPNIHWTRDKATGSTHHLHCLNQEPVTIHGKPDGIVYKNYR